jgi:FkbM family methyltransferase
MQILNKIKNLVKKIPYIAYWARVIIYQIILMKTNKHPEGYFFSGTFLMETGRFEIEETIVVKNQLSKSDRLINIGANVGYYVCIAMKMGKEVTAFEPLHSNLNILYKNLILNKWDKGVEIFPVALGSASALEKLYGYGTGASLIKKWAGSDLQHYRVVPTVLLDNSISQRFTKEKLLIVADIEGYELEMLYGAEKTLQLNPKPIWIIEVSFTEHIPDGNIKKIENAKKLFSLMWKNGYKSYFADNNYVEITPKIFKKIITNKSMILSSNNFIFADKKHILN